jgi:hypothetical protein
LVVFRAAAEALSLQTLNGHGPRAVGGGADLQLGATPSTSADNPAADAAAQRDRSLVHDAETGLGAMQATSEVKADFVLDPGRFRTKLPVKAISQSPQSCWG